jgi:hypothetical protein
VLVASHPHDVLYRGMEVLALRGTVVDLIYFLELEVRWFRIIDFLQ